MDRVRIGFIGAGGIASRHIGNLLGFPDVEIVGVADPAPDRAVTQAERAGARAYADHHALFASERLDGLYICTPPFAHGAPELAAIERNLPFFVEKPIAAGLEAAEAIERSMTGQELVTSVGYHWRYLDTVVEAAERLAESPALLVSGYWLDRTPPPQWWVREVLSGGQMVEQATHIVDLARHLVGEIDEVFAVVATAQRPDFPESDIATGTAASLRFASGAVGSLSTTCLLRWPHRIGLHLFGDGLAIELTEFEIMVDVGNGRPVRRAEGDPFVRADRDFIDAVKGVANRIRVPYAEALRTHRAAIAIAHSARTGQPIRLAGPHPEKR
jgi:predicted dehydrogenase